MPGSGRGTLQHHEFPSTCNTEKKLLNGKSCSHKNLGNACTFTNDSTLADRKEAISRHARILCCTILCHDEYPQFFFVRRDAMRTRTNFSVFTYRYAQVKGVD